VGCGVSVVWGVLEAPQSEAAGLEAGCRRRSGRGGSVEAGGMPPSRFEPHSGRYLSFAEREEIAICRAYGYGVREIARHLGRDPSTVSLVSCAATPRPAAACWCIGRSSRSGIEIVELSARRRPGSPRTSGFVTTCRIGSPARSARPTASPCPGLRLDGSGGGTAAVRAGRWASSWSPEQIANRLPVDFPDDESIRISHEALYQALYIQGRGALRREVTACLRTGRALRVPRARTRGRGKDVRHSQDPDQRAPGRGRGPGSARALGRRPDPRAR